MNTGKLESVAVVTVKEYLVKCPKLEVHIGRNDKTPLWDGDVIIYKSKEHKTENFFARVPLVVKGTSNGKDYFYGISREFLDGFKAERGAVIFMVQVGDNTSKILYALLSSKDIEILLQQTTDTIRINLNEVPEIPLKFEQRILDFATKRNREEVENTSPKEICKLVEGFEEIRVYLDEIENEGARNELEALLDSIKSLKDDGSVLWRNKFYYYSRKAIDLAINNIKGRDFVDLQVKLGKYLQEQKQYHLVKDYFSNALEEYHKRADKVNEAANHNNRGKLYRALTRYDDAEKEYKDALKIYRELVQTNHDAFIGYVATTLYNLGNIHSDLKRYDEAENEYKEALKIYHELAQTNRDAFIKYEADTLNNLGNLHSNHYHYDEAENEYKESLEIYRELAQTNRDAYIGDVAKALNNLGNLHLNLKRYDEAEKEYNKALEIDRELAKTNPDAHIADVATDLNNLAILHNDLKNYRQAEKEYKEALEIYRELAKTNRDTYIKCVADTLNNLGALHDDFKENEKENEKEQAEKEYKESLEIYRELAQTNRDAYIGYVATTLNNLAFLHYNLSRYSEAEKGYKEAMEIRHELAKTNPDDNSVKIAQILNNLAILYEALTRYDKARESAKEALGIYDYLAKKYPQIWTKDVDDTKQFLQELTN